MRDDLLFLRPRGLSGVPDAATATALEAELHTAWESRDFAAWDAARGVYADYLEEINSPLYPMARAAIRYYPRTVKTKGGPRVWLWCLIWRLPDDTTIRSAWARNRRINAAPLFGLPRLTLRCTALPVENGQRLARFTVSFKPRRESQWKPNARQGLSGFHEAKVAYDCAIHPLGFPRMFWPRGFEPTGVLPGQGPQPGLFDKLEG